MYHRNNCDGKRKLYMIDERTKERFWSKVDKRGKDECWEWTAGISKNGYGSFNLLKKQNGAHRASWIIFNNKPIPRDMLIIHSCDNPICVNPKHLFLGTTLDNVRDKIKKGRNSSTVGEHNGNSKLTEEQVKDIRKYYVKDNSRKNLVYLSKKHGVVNGTIYNIVNNITWRHVK